MNLRWPAEWEPQQAVWLAWPHNVDDWPERFGPIPWVYGDFISKLCRVVHVHLIAAKPLRAEMFDILNRFGVPADSMTLYDLVTDRVWTRDFCPIFVQSHQDLKAVKWQFNAWAKYENWHADDSAGKDIHSDGLVLPMHHHRRIVLEGGSIDSNGHGTMLTTKECLLDTELQCRNQGFNQTDYETAFKQYLGIEKTIWLNRGIVGDDTHGHIDDLARFVDSDIVVCVYEPDTGDANHETTQENLDILRNSTTADGKIINVVTLPMPAPIVFNGQRLPASYANFLITNKTVFVPTFNDPMDRQALGILAHCFPQRNVVGIHCGDLIWGLGTLHCMTMQMAATT